MPPPPTHSAPCLRPRGQRPCAKRAATLSRANERMRWEAPAERQGADGRHRVPGARAAPVPLLITHSHSPPPRVPPARRAPHPAAYLGDVF
jgi:hypothetical protein